MKRRAVLALSGSLLSVSAGCSYYSLTGESDGSGHQLWVTNESDEDVTATIAITDDDTTVFSDTVDLTPGYRWRLDEALTVEGPLVVTVDVANGPSETTEWTRPSVEGVLHADIHDGYVDFGRSVP